MLTEYFDSFPNLRMLEWSYDEKKPISYNAVGIDHLINADFDESGSIVKFVSACSGNAQEIDWQNLLTLKADTGICTDVYAPSVFQKEGVLVVQSGNNTFTCHQQKNKFLCGHLVGELYGKDVKYTDTNGADKSYSKPYIKFVDPQDEEGDEYYIAIQTIKRDEAIAQCLIGANEWIDYPMLATLSRKGESISKLVSASFGGGFTKLTELELGEYQILGFTRLNGEYGPQYRLRMADGSTVMSNKKLTELLDMRGSMLAKGAMTLKIVKIEKLKNGKLSATATILPKLPYQTNLSPTTAQPQAQLLPERIRVSIPEIGALNVPVTESVPELVEAIPL